MFATGGSKREIEAAEAKLLEYSGLSKGTIKSYETKIKFANSDWKKGDEEEVKSSSSSFWACCSSRPEYDDITESCHIWTYECGDSKKPTLLLIHGYQSSALIFFKMFKYLSESFHVYAIDLLGMGRSARPKFTCSTSEELDKFYASSIDKWREANGIKTLNVAGYAFGAYVAAKYALHYPKLVKNLILLSPFGVEGKDFQTVNMSVDEAGCCAKLGTGCLCGAALCICCPCTALCCLPCTCCAGTYSLMGDVTKALNELFNTIGVHTGGYHHDEKVNEGIFKLSEEEQEAFSEYYKYFLKQYKPNDSNDTNFKKALTDDDAILTFISQFELKINNI